MTINKRRILFVHSQRPGQLASFVKQDLLLLQERYQVEELSLAITSVSRGISRSRTIWKAIARNDLVFCWFSNGLIAAMSKILGKSMIIVGGGFDVVSIPEIDYGLQSMSRRRRWITLLGFKLADRVLLFSDSSKKHLSAALRGHTGNLQTLYLGVDSEYFKPAGEKKKQALTVGYIKEINLLRKGLQTFVETAAITPEVSYHLAGKPVDQSAVEKINTAATPNFHYLGYVNDQQLLKEYQQAKVYAQLSMHEGFGLALAEAMACECIPIVTDCGAIPEVVGDTGTYVPIQDPQATSEAIRQAIEREHTAGQHARERIISLFPISKRRNGLYKDIESIL